MEIDNELVEAYRQAVVACRNTDAAICEFGDSIGWVGTFTNDTYLALKDAHDVAFRAQEDAQYALMNHIDAKLGL